MKDMVLGSCLVNWETRDSIDIRGEKEKSETIK